MRKLTLGTTALAIGMLVGQNAMAQPPPPFPFPMPPFLPLPGQPPPPAPGHQPGYGQPPPGYGPGPGYGQPPPAHGTGSFGNGPPPPPRRKPTQSFNVGLKLGALFPGSADADPGGSFDTGVGVLGDLSLDLLVVPQFSIGAFVLAARPTVEVGNVSEAGTLVTFGPTFKGRLFGDPGEFQLRPGLMIGYQILSADQPGVDGSKGLDIGAVIEVFIPVDSDNLLGIPIEVGFVSQPVGGNSDADITFAPIFFAAAGFEIGG